jgi:DNA-binding PadR family transcriptional regulator
MNWNPLVRRQEKVALHVAAVLLALPDEDHYGLDLCQRTRSSSGLVYPALIAFEEEGWVDSGWQDNPEPGRRPRRWYRVSETGRRALAALLRG